MSKATKRKHVTREVLDDYVLPKEDEMIVKILGGRGNNLHEVLTCNGDKYLVSMPTKFRKNVWIKRGDFVLTKPIEEGEKVKAEIISILYSNQIKYIQSQGKWPQGFCDSNQTTNNDEEEGVNLSNNSSDSSDNSDVDDIFVNTNRPQCMHESSDSSEVDADE
uniref:Probable RNA-binding protein EIF1AD n=1 Tax=Evadne anonyx TaxID=141404 RepID=A0A9N6WVE9_9CRUS|nr:EOG090X0KPP [Evadne anonyx]